VKHKKWEKAKQGKYRRKSCQKSSTVGKHEREGFMKPKNIRSWWSRRK
jgi:hypothetical protein